MNDEPARIVALGTAATAATVNVLALVLHWGPDLTAGLNIALAGWIAVAGEIVRARVTPVKP